MALPVHRPINTYASSETTMHGPSDPLDHVERALRTVVQAAWDAGRWDIIEDMRYGRTPKTLDEVAESEETTTRTDH